MPFPTYPPVAWHAIFLPAAPRDGVEPKQQSAGAVVYSTYVEQVRATMNGPMRLCPLNWVRVASRYAHPPSIK
jgi:hypothetical protein